MAFDGNVYLVSKPKGTVKHLGIKVSDGSVPMIVCACTMDWYQKDINSIGKAEEVTCKRCRKVLERADSKGRIIL